MDDFLKFFYEKVQSYQMHLSISYSKIIDWCIEVTKIGCADMYPDAVHSGNDVVIVQVQHSDMELAFAKAHVELKEWLLEHDGGY